jgi:hypothetical protein
MGTDCTHFEDSGAGQRHRAGVNGNQTSRIAGQQPDGLALVRFLNSHNAEKGSFKPVQHVVHENCEDPET